MRRTGILGVAIMLILGLGVTASQAAKPKKVKTEAEVEGVSELNQKTQTVVIIGDIHSKKSKCERGRKVTLRYTGPQPARAVGEATTDRTGDWSVGISFDDFENGVYVAEVDRKKVGKGEKRIKCKSATSPGNEINLVF